VVLDRINSAGCSSWGDVRAEPLAVKMNAWTRAVGAISLFLAVWPNPRVVSNQNFDEIGR